MRTDLFDAKFLKFVLVGLSNTLISYAIFALALRALPDIVWQALLSQVLSYSGGTLWSYYWNRRWSFRSRESIASEMPRFVAVQVLCLTLSAFLVGLAVDVLGFPATLSWIAVMGGIVVINFLLLRLWVFRTSEPKPCKRT